MSNDDDSLAPPKAVHDRRPRTSSHQRTFAQLSDAVQFRAKAIDIAASLVTLEPAGAGFAVAYSTASEAPLANYRRGSSYSEDEAKGACGGGIDEGHDHLKMDS